MQNDDFSHAAQHFQQYVSSDRRDPAIVNDARLRLADSRFMLRNYGQALDVYNSVIASSGSGIDYALYQKGMIEGLRGKNENKEANREGIIRQSPRSGYADDA